MIPTVAPGRAPEEIRYLPLIPSAAPGGARASEAQSPTRTDGMALSAAARAAGSDPDLQAALQAAARRWGLEDAGVVLTDLSRGRAAALNAGKVFSSASVIKVAVMAEAFHQAQAGRISLDQEVTITPQNRTDTWHPDNDRRPYLKPGDRVTVRQLVELMITRSDNVATNTLLDLVGRQRLNAFLAGQGVGTTQFHHKLSGGAIPVRDPGYDGGRNQTTARDMARLLELIATGRLVSPAASREMLAILGGQLDDTKIPARLPPGATVYHKTGETSRVTHDVAVVEAGGRRYVLAVLTNRGPGPDTYKRMAGLAADLHARLAGG